jgi:hypothetical protein
MARIDDYRFGHIVIDGEEQTLDVIILPDRLVLNWWRHDGHSLVLADLDDVIEELPEHLVIGSGAHGRMHPEPATLEDLRGRGIEIEVYETAEAVKRYGDLDPRLTGAALHLTC